MTETRSAAASAPPDIVIERIFDAPRALVFQAWTDPEWVKRWWGPEHFTAPAATVDLRVGGRYHFCMRTPDGQDLWSTGVYQEIVPQERLVFLDSFADAEGNVVSPTAFGMGADFPPETLVVLTFEALSPSQTKMTLRHSGTPLGEMLELTKSGWSTSFDKLAAALVKAPAG